MKSLRKADIETLRKEMPVLVESEEKEVVGGTYYYDNQTGEYLGTVGASDELRFIDSGLYRNAEISEDPYGGVAFTEVSGDVQKRFLANLFANGNNVVEDTNQIAGVNSHGVLKYNPSSSLWNNYHDAMCLMEHENAHFQSGHHLVSGDKQNAENEIEVYKKQDYSNTTSALKQEAADAIIDNGQKAMMSYNERYDLLSGLGLLGYQTVPI